MTKLSPDGEGIATTSSWKAWLSSAQGYIAFFSALIGVLSAWQSYVSKESADAAARGAQQAKLELEKAAHERAERETRARFDTTAYEAVVKVLEASATAPASVMSKREKAAIALVLQTASENLKQALLEVLKSNPTVSAESRETLEKAVEAMADLAPNAGEFHAGVSAPVPTPAGPAPTPNRLENYRIVFFYCQSSDTAAAQRWRSTAEALRAELANDARLKNVTPQVKELVEVLNSSPGYQIYTYQIRYNPDEGEEQSSLALRALLASTAAAPGENFKFERRAVRKRTPNYLSVFLCGRTPV